MGQRPAIGYCLTSEGKLLDIVLFSQTASDPSPTQTELELLRIFAEYKEMLALLLEMANENDDTFDCASCDLSYQADDLLNRLKLNTRPRKEPRHTF